MITENVPLRGLRGQNYKLGKLIGRGGEGNVYLVPGTNLVAKLMSKAIPMHEQKLCYMVTHPIPDLLDSAGVPILHMAWPTDVLYDDNGQYLGYTMPYIEGGVEIFEIDRGCHSQKAMSLFPEYNWGVNIQVAHNLAMAVDYLHNQGCVVGDMNCKNILVNENRTIIILDADSFDVRDNVNNIHYKCGVGTEDYLPPELQGRNLRLEAAQFNEHTDDFALAVHIFQLLMGNYHPFSCRQLISAKNSSNATPRLEQIVNGQSPYIHKYQNVDIPLGAPTIKDTLPDYIHQLFIDTFSYDKHTVQERIAYRTTAEKWATSLARLRAECEVEGGLVQCEKDPTHYYLSSKPECGFCKAKQRLHSAPHGKPQTVTIQKETRQPAPVRVHGKQDHRVVREDKPAGNGSRKRILWVAAAVLLAAVFGYFLRAITAPDPFDEYRAETYPQETIPETEATEAFSPVDSVIVEPKAPEETMVPETTVPETTASEDPIVTIAYMGGEYSGTLLDGVPEGRGVLTWQEGCYTGQFHKGYPEGEGKFYYMEGSEIAELSGQWSYGWCMLEYERGSWQGDRYAEYTGMLLQGEPAGYGKLDFSEGNSYQGVFVDGRPGGEGFYCYADGTRESGTYTWTEDKIMFLHDSREGGTMYYTGMMKQGEPSGYGILTFEKGGTFYGEFCLGTVDGTGVYVFRTLLAQNYDTIYGSDWSLVYGHRSANYPGYEYYGLMLRGSWQGYGLGITPKKYHYVGEVRDNIRSGYGRLYTPDNQIYQEGMFSEGYLVK